MFGALPLFYLLMVFDIFVIFVDAHTKLIWFYPHGAKSIVFHQFQVLVERQFSCKIKSVQTDWVVNIIN